MIRTEDDIVLTFKKAKSNFPWVRPGLQLYSIFLDTIAYRTHEIYYMLLKNIIYRFFKFSR